MVQDVSQVRLERIVEQEGEAARVAAETERLSVRNSFRTTLLQGLGGLVLVLGAVSAAKQLSIAREAQVTERYTRAIDQLGARSVDVRIGGIYSLEMISRDSPGDRSSVVDVLVAYVTRHAPWPPPNRSPPHVDPRRSVLELPDGTISPAPIGDVSLSHRAPDVQAAITVLGRIERRAGDRPLLLRNTDLRGADMSNSNFAAGGPTDLSGSHLEEANLAAANLDGAVLVGAHLDGALLMRTAMHGALLERSSMRGATIIEAHLEGAVLAYADLSNAKSGGGRSFSSGSCWSGLSEGKAYRRQDGRR